MTHSGPEDALLHSVPWRKLIASDFREGGVNGQLSIKEQAHQLRVCCSLVKNRCLKTESSRVVQTEKVTDLAGPFPLLLSMPEAPTHPPTHPGFEHPDVQHTKALIS